MVLCVIPGCGNRTGRDQGVGFYRIPAVVTNKGEFEEKLTAERRKEWIKAISRGDTEEKQVLESERVCGKHFVSGKPAPYWNRYHDDWIPTLNLGKKKYGPEVDVKANAQRTERAKKREQLAIARQERQFHSVIIFIPFKRRKTPHPTPEPVLAEVNERPKDQNTTLRARVGVHRGRE